MADNLQELFARLKAQSEPHSQSPPAANTSHQAPSIWANPNQQPSQSSGPSSIFSPPASSPAGIVNPARSASAASNVAASDQQRTNSLLNLLKFNNGQAGNQQAQGGPMASLQNVSIGRSASASGSRPADTRAISAQGLVATLQRQTGTPGAKAPIAAGADVLHTHVSTSSGNQQDFLLNLLKKPSAATPPPAETPIKVEAQEEMKSLAENLAETSIKQEASDPVAALRQSTPIRHFGSPEVGGSGFDASSSMSKAAKFTHLNPFEQLHASSPLNRSPKPEVQGKRMELLKHDRDVSSAVNGDSQQPAHKTRKLPPDEEPKASPLPAERKSVAEALERVGDVVGKEVTQALAQASSCATTNGAKQAKKEVNGDKHEVESSWESAEDSATEKTAVVTVYNFPMKPFVTIKVKPLDDVFPVRQDHFMQIANLKKDFDQTDRCLVTASQSHIVYAQPATKKENKGLKIIQQDSGEHKSVFNQHGERVFNVQMCTPGDASNDVEAVLGTGVDGSVFWTSLARSNPNLFADDDVEGQGFIMPPVATLEENSSGSPIKTRAKLSTRHPDFFAIGRGKQIHIVGPDIVKDYCLGSSRKVDSEKYFLNHSLKLSTGKAGKDFCFSEDDSTIVSLDKSGRVKFWDIRDLSRRAAERNESGKGPADLREPMWQLIANASNSKADEKPSVSSVMLLDKDRPHTKGLALRYMLIGFKQNHILQLWDLGLGKAVQEVCLPHEKDSDGICSIAYHPKTGIIAVGHPTRNSIYFIHLSAPKYNLGNMEHATFISMIANHDPTLPKPESTAIMSGIREVSFARAGQIRSIDMLRTPVDLVNEKGSEDETVFELYIMHAKGVTGMSVKKADLGWDVNNKLVKFVDAKEVGAAEVTELRIPPRVFTPSEAETPTKKAPEKKEDKKHETPKKTESKKEAGPVPKPAAQEPSKQAGSGQIAAKSPAVVADAASLSKEAERFEAAPRDVGQASTDDIGKRFDILYQRLESDRRVAEAAGVAKQEAVLRLISSTLTENVEQSLHTIVGNSIEQKVLPALPEQIKALDRQLAENLPQQLDRALPRELKAAIPGALQTAFKDPQLSKMISDMAASQISNKVQQQVAGLIQQSMANIETQVVQRITAAFERQLQEAEKRRQQDNAKIEELVGLVRDLMEQQATLSEQLRAVGAVTNSQGNDSAVSALNTTETDPEEEEMEEITSKLVARDFEAATLQWLQSPRQSQLFDRLFIRVNPQYLNQVNPLVALSVSAAITATFETNVDARLDWLMSVLSQINVQDPDVIDVAPGIMDVLSQRLQGAYMNISEANPSNAVLRKISEVNRRVNEVRRMTA